MLYETLTYIINFPAEIGIIGYILIGVALTILMMYIFTFLLEFFLHFFRT